MQGPSTKGHYPGFSILALELKFDRWQVVGVYRSKHDILGEKRTFEGTSKTGDGLVLLFRKQIVHRLTAREQKHKWQNKPAHHFCFAATTM